MEKLPALEAVLTDESFSDACRDIMSSIPFDEPSAIRTDVHWCQSETCLPCRRHVRPKFLPVPNTSANNIRRLPQRWWIEEYYDADFVESIVSSLFCAFGGKISVREETKVQGSSSKRKSAERKLRESAKERQSANEQLSKKQPEQAVHSSNGLGTSVNLSEQQLYHHEPVFVLHHRISSAPKGQKMQPDADLDVPFDELYQSQTL